MADVEPLSDEIRLLRFALAGVTDLTQVAPELAPLAARHADGLARVRAMLGLSDFASPTTPGAVAAMFDRWAGEDAALAVAAYSFGDVALLAEFTAEVVAVAADWADLSGDLLDFGCGTGRVAGALVGRARSVTGVDVSAAMLARAAAAVPAARFMLSDGGALPLADASIDVALAVDSMPFVVQAGTVGRELAEFARVLRPGGRLLVFNFTYGDPAPVAGWIAASPLRLARGPERPFRRWDATAWALDAA